MKIGPSSELPVSVTSPHAAAQKAAQSGAAPAAAATSNAKESTRSAGVAVTVSTLARGLEKPDRAEIADVDTKKVEAMRTAIQGGTYTVNPEAIADKLLANAQEMLNRTNS